LFFENRGIPHPLQRLEVDTLAKLFGILPRKGEPKAKVFCGLGKIIPVK